MMSSQKMGEKGYVYQASFNAVLLTIVVKGKNVYIAKA